MTQINLGIFYAVSKVNRKLSINLTKEAIESLLPFREIPYIQDHLQTAFKILEYWGIDYREYLNKELQPIEY